MEKQVRKFEIDFDFNWTYGVQVEKLKADLEALEKLGATEIEIEAGCYYGSSTITIKAYSERIETDDEYNHRINIVKKQVADIRRREMAELERLKSKYENGLPQ